MCQVDWSAAAAWMQAVFSVVAIGVAIWLGERQHERTRDMLRDERAREDASKKERQRINAVMVASALAETANQAERVHMILGGLELKDASRSVEDSDLNYLQGIFAAANPAWVALSPHVQSAVSELDFSTNVEVTDVLRRCSLYSSAMTGVWNLVTAKQAKGAQIMMSAQSGADRATQIGDKAKDAVAKIIDAYGLPLKIPPVPEETAV